jgi:hypothetical protein
MHQRDLTPPGERAFGDGSARRPWWSRRSSPAHIIASASGVIDEAHGHINLDCARLDALDKQTLGVIVTVARNAQRRGQRVILDLPPERVGRDLGDAGVSYLFSLSTRSAPPRSPRTRDGRGHRRDREARSEAEAATYYNAPPEWCCRPFGRRRTSTCGFRSDARDRSTEGESVRGWASDETHEKVDVAVGESSGP